MGYSFLKEYPFDNMRRVRRCYIKRIWRLIIVLGCWGLIASALWAEGNSIEKQKKVVIYLRNGQEVEGILLRYHNGIWQVKIHEDKVETVSEEEISKVEVTYLAASTQPESKPESQTQVESKQHESSPPTVSDGELQVRITRLIKKLGDDAWQTREEATKELEGIGKEALPALKEAVENTKDPEIKWRAKLLIDAIEGSGRKKRPQPDDDEALPEWMQRVPLPVPGGIIIPMPPDIPDFPPIGLLDSFEKAMKLHIEGKYAKAIQVYKELIEELDAEATDTIGDFKATCEYNIACAYSLLKKADEAMEFLDKALKDGFTNYTHIEQDPDLNNVRDDPRYKKLMGIKEEQAQEDEKR